MNRMVRFLAAGAFFLSACSTSPSAVPSTPANTPTSRSQIKAGSDPFAPVESSGQVNEQGAVDVEVAPPSFSTSTGKVEFEVDLNTHSVDLAMDLAALSKLTTDNGLSVGAASWDAPRGGHHTRGKLSFSIPSDARALLQSASKLTLTIRDLDVPSRVFEWDLK